MNRWLSLSITLAVVALAGSLYLYGWQRDAWPEMVATHWGIEGKADGFTPRDNWFLWLGLPLVMFGWVGLTLLLPWISPKGFQVEGFRGTYDYLMSLVNVFFLYMHGVILFGALWGPERTVLWVLGGVFLLVGLLGVVLGQVKRNFWMGIRTPWTLADVGVWETVHQQAAILYPIASLVAFVAVLLGANLIAVFVGFMLAMLWPALYSLVLYKYRERHNLLRGQGA